MFVSEETQTVAQYAINFAEMMKQDNTVFQKAFYTGRVLVLAECEKVAVPRECAIHFMVPELRPLGRAFVAGMNLVPGSYRDQTIMQQMQMANLLARIAPEPFHIYDATGPVI